MLFFVIRVFVAVISLIMSYLEREIHRKVQCVILIVVITVKLLCFSCMIMTIQKEEIFY